VRHLASLAVLRIVTTPPSSSVQPIGISLTEEELSGAGFCASQPEGSLSLVIELTDHLSP
jgi:hypothetical protein